MTSKERLDVLKRKVPTFRNSVAFVKKFPDSIREESTVLAQKFGIATVADHIGISAPTLHAWRKQGVISTFSEDSLQVTRLSVEQPKYCEQKQFELRFRFRGFCLDLCRENER